MALKIIRLSILAAWSLISAFAQSPSERAKEEVRAVIKEMNMRKVPGLTDSAFSVGAQYTDILTGDALKKYSQATIPPNISGLTRVIRLSASDAGDMVSELSSAVVKDGATVVYEGLIMRNWKRVNGTWLIDGSMSRRKESRQP